MWTLGHTGEVISADILYVSFQTPEKIDKYDLSGNLIGTLNTVIGGVNGIDIDSAGNLYANIGNYGVRKYAPNGDILNNLFPVSLPAAVTIDASDSVYVANVGSGQVTKYDSAGTLLYNLTHADMGLPYGVAVNSSGVVYIGGTSNKIVKFSSTGTYLGTISTGNLNAPRGMAFDSLGNLYVANHDNSTISRYDSNDTYLGSITSNVFKPTGLAIDSSNTIYVSNFNGLIQKYDTSGSHVGTFSGAASAFSWLAIAPTPVPEPSTYVLGTLAVGVFAALARRKRSMCETRS